MAQRIDCLIDTTPMADEIRTVSNHIEGTTTAVVAMQTAVVLAEKQAAETVCRNVNRGFYTLMRSQISQKIAKLKSEVDSQLMQLNAHRKQLLAIRGRMERDYHLLTQRYLKLFNELNLNLKQRVFELDRPVFDFAIHEVEKTSNRTKYLAATVPISQVESLSNSQKIITSNVRYKAEKVIETMQRYLTNTLAQKKMTNKVLLSKNTTETVGLAVPVIIVERNFDALDHKNLDVIVSPEELTVQTHQSIKNAVYQCVESLNWQNTTDWQAEVKSEFSKYLSNNNASERVKHTAQKLFAATHCQTLKNE